MTRIDKQDKYADLARLLCSEKQSDYAMFLGQISPILRRVLARRVPQSDVEDVVQEVLISIHKARHTYDDKRKIMPWVMAIANFRTTDYLRKHYAGMHHKTTDISELSEILADKYEDGENNENIDELLADVPEKHRQILTLLHVDGYTAKEVGKQLSMNESAVKVTAHRAIKKIRARGF
jgi:RNA polymerase sigma-70 factor (ECF subfamily)